MNGRRRSRACRVTPSCGCGCRPPVRSSSRGGWWTVTVYLRYRAELGCTCRPSIYMPLHLAAALIAMEGDPCCAGARGEAGDGRRHHGRWRGRRQRCRSSTARRRRAPAGSGVQAATSDPSELPPLGLLDRDDDGDEALSLEALRLLLAARDATDAAAPDEPPPRLGLPPSEPREATRAGQHVPCPCPCPCVHVFSLTSTTEAAGSVM